MPLGNPITPSFKPTSYDWLVNSTPGKIVCELWNYTTSFWQSPYLILFRYEQGKLPKNDEIDLTPSKISAHAANQDLPRTPVCLIKGSTRVTFPTADSAGENLSDRFTQVCKDIFDASFSEALFSTLHQSVLFLKGTNVFTQRVIDKYNVILSNAAEKSPKPTIEKISPISCIVKVTIRYNAILTLQGTRFEAKKGFFGELLHEYQLSKTPSDEIQAETILMEGRVYPELEQVVRENKLNSTVVRKLNFEEARNLDNPTAGEDDDNTDSFNKGLELKI